MSTDVARPKPFSCEEIVTLAREHFGLQASATPLQSYIDQNFLLQTNAGQRYVLKLAFGAEQYDPLDLENQAMCFLNRHSPDLQLPQVLENNQGERLTRLERQGHVGWLRLLSYLPGRFMVDSLPHQDSLLESIGRYFARIDRCLQGFFHPAMHRDTPWDLQRGYRVAQMRLYAVEDAEKRAHIEYFLQLYREQAAPLLGKLRSSVIHNDANDYNILVEMQDGRQTVCGVIDFGDMTYTHTVNELAIAAVYAMLDKDDPIAAACQVVRGYHAALPLQDAEIASLFSLIGLRLCVSIAVSADTYRRHPENEYLLISQAPVWALLQRLRSVDADAARAAFYRACGWRDINRGRSDEEIMQFRRRHLGKTLSVSYKKPLKIVRGAGAYLYDRHGRAYLDMVNNVCHVGHCHPRVVAAGQRQMALLNTNTRYLHDTLIDYTERLLSALPPPLSVVMFVNSGSEANELAMRLARCHTGHQDMLVIEGAYHGNTQACIDISPYKFDGPGGRGAPDWVHKVMLPDPYRGHYKGLDADSGRRYAEDVEQTIKRLAAQNRAPCAFICESLQGVAGQIIMPQDYLKTAYRYVRAAGGVCIADEVQVGFGRVGHTMWAFATQDVVPDIVTLGKPIGNGHPLAAVITTPEIAESFVTGMEYFNTFGGNPVSCAIGLAVLDVIDDEHLMQNALHTGEYMRAGLRELQQKHHCLGDVRGLGLFNGVEFVQDGESLAPAAELLSQTVEQMKEKGILLSTEGSLHNVLKIKPPIVFNQANTDEFLQKLDSVLSDLPQ